MAPAPRDDDLAAAIQDMLAALDLGSPDTAKTIGQKILRRRQDRTLDRLSEEDDAPAEGAHSSPEPTKTELRKREQDRQQLVKAARPEILLAPVNLVAVFLKDQPIWRSWSWADTEAVNGRMFAFAQQVSQDRLPEDSRLALPLTAAGFYLYRALHSGTWENPLDLVANVYYEIGEGIVQVNKSVIEAARLKHIGDAPEEFVTTFAGIANTADLLLMHAAGLGPDKWKLILRCALGAGCRRGEPYYVARPGKPGKLDHHGECRTAKVRGKQSTSLGRERSL
jgi:hypothetical protein